MASVQWRTKQSKTNFKKMDASLHTSHRWESWLFLRLRESCKTKTIKNKIKMYLEPYLESACPSWHAHSHPFTHCLTHTDTQRNKQTNKQEFRFCRDSEGGLGLSLECLWVCRMKQRKRKQWRPGWSPRGQDWTGLDLIPSRRRTEVDWTGTGLLVLLLT